MTLKEILNGKNNVRIKEYERWGDKLIFIGGCYYANKIFIPLDKGFYSNCTKITAYEWKNDEVLMIVR